MERRLRVGRGLAYGAAWFLLFAVVVPIVGQFSIDAARGFGLLDDPTDWASRAAVGLVGLTAALSQHPAFSPTLWFSLGAAIALWGDLRLRRLANPFPVFGDPEEMFPHRPDLAWWFLPVSAAGGADDFDARIEHCTVLATINGGDPVEMRWYVDDHRSGATEAVLLEGATRHVPLVIRVLPGSGQILERCPDDGVARVTGAAYLRNNLVNRLPLPPGEHAVQVTVKSGRREWKTPAYRVTIPSPEQGKEALSVRIAPSSTGPADRKRLQTGQVV